ncbi:MAG TPA: PhoPQ-activated protein PqaA family protein [Steroidobacteraceae bacterium]|nr:PhoPQ-activated protein PqaA family protein [Steroidobacteraceae bacterium]
MKYSLLLALVWLLVAPAARASGELAQYVEEPDPAYHWDVLRSGRFAGGDYLELLLTSQTWRDIEWKHQLYLFRPRHLDTTSRQAFLYIDGGRWNPQYEAGQNGLPRDSVVFSRLADSLHAVVAVVRQVPFQPMFDRREDALIAYTFDRYLATGDSDWPLLLPMVKAAMRAMDTVQTVAQERWQLPIERFTISGASKRGWTSWLTAAMDPRIAATAPMVIDMLNLPEQIRLQKATFGGLSEQVHDYEQIDLPGRIDSDTGRKLISMVDPYSYRASLTQPKLIVLATNDRYWPLDALSLYWSGIPEPKRVLYVPNQGHGIHDVQRLMGALSALHRYSAKGATLPELHWNFDTSKGAVNLDVQSSVRPTRVVAWRASSSTRDFRNAHWSARSCHKTRNSAHCATKARANEYVALYSEATFRDRSAQEFSLSTAVCIIDANGAMVRECLDNPETPATVAR